MIAVIKSLLYPEHKKKVYNNEETSNLTEGYPEQIFLPKKIHEWSSIWKDAQIIYHKKRKSKTQ